MHGIQPNLVLYLHLTLEQAQERVRKRMKKLTSFEKEHEHYWKSVIKGYDTIFANRDNVVQLDAMQSPEDLCAQALEEVKRALAI